MCCPAHTASSSQGCGFQFHSDLLVAWLGIAEFGQPQSSISRASDPGALPGCLSVRKGRHKRHCQRSWHTGEGLVHLKNPRLTVWSLCLGTFGLNPFPGAPRLRPPETRGGTTSLASPAASMAVCSDWEDKRSSGAQSDRSLACRPAGAQAGRNGHGQ